MLAAEARAYYDMPGLDGLGLPPPVPWHWKHNPEEIFHFPDGNAGVARLLVKSLIPAALNARDMEEQVTARLDYSQLDRAHSNVRLRLSSTVVNVNHVGRADRAAAVATAYLCGGKACKVHSRHVVMACHNSMIPFVCPELPEVQRTALAHAVRDPLVYTNVFVRNWRPWQELGVHFIHSLSGWHTEVKLGVTMRCRFVCRSRFSRHCRFTGHRTPR
jgi:spermidine dehydrogenase